MDENPPSTSTPNEIPFSSENNFEWDQKKQNIILNLSLTSNTDSDQTPTPTRFIRNCEEVGLFQDLQNVNPFDELFKKAVENQTPASLQIPTTDDTLHTPQIYPQIEDSTNTSTTTDKDNHLVINIDLEKETSESTNVCNNSNSTKEKLKASVLKKGAVGPALIKKLRGQTKEGVRTESNIALLLKQREANKAAQSRSRNRKKQAFENMKLQNKLLKEQNTKLRATNLYLQQTIVSLQEQLKEAKSGRQDKCSSEISPNTSQNTKKQVTQSTLATKASSDSLVGGNNMNFRRNKNFTPIMPKPAVHLANIQNSGHTVVLVCPQIIPAAVGVSSTGCSKSQNSR